MGEAALTHIVGAQGIHHRVAIFQEAGVRLGINVQGSQRHQHLRVGLAVRVAIAGIAAIDILPIGQQRQRRVHSRLDLSVGLVVGSQRLERHGRHIHIRRSAAEIPAAACDLLIQNEANQILPARLGLAVGDSGDLIAVAVQRKQRIGRAIDALSGHGLEVSQRCKQIIAAHIARIITQRGQRQNGA